MNKFWIPSIAVGILVVGIADRSPAATINFDDQGLTGPSTAAEAGPAQTLNISTPVGNVRFEGGVIFTNSTNAPADETSVYGTSAGIGGDPSLTNPLTITFANPVNNFFLDVLNGNTQNVSYTVADNKGNSQTFNLPPNTESGQKQIGFAATGNVVTITSLLSPDPSVPFDFVIDNIHFDEPLPPSIAVPEPSSALGILAFGAVGVCSLLKRKVKKQTITKIFSKNSGV